MTLGGTGTGLLLSWRTFAGVSGRAEKESVKGPEGWLGTGVTTPWQSQASGNPIVTRQAGPRVFRGCRKELPPIRWLGAMCVELHSRCSDMDTGPCWGPREGLAGRMSSEGSWGEHTSCLFQRLTSPGSPACHLSAPPKPSAQRFLCPRKTRVHSSRIP